MAAFEHISRYQIQPMDAATSIDIRLTKLPKEIPPFDGYDPREHRRPLTPIKNYMAYYNMMRTIIGTGLLGYPVVITKAGLVLGSILVLSLGLLVTYTHHLLLESLNEVARRLKIAHVSYRYGFRLALLHGPFQYLGFHGPAIIASCMIVSQIGICSVIIIYSSESLRDILDWESNRSVVLILFVPFLVMEILMTNLTIVTYISHAGNMVNIIALVVVIYLVAQDMQGSELGMKYYTTDPLTLSYAFGHCLFNTSAVGVLLGLDRSLEDAKVLLKPFGVNNVGILVPTLVGLVFGIFCYFSRGEMEDNILRFLPLDDNLTLFAIAVYMFSVACVYPIQCYPGMLITIEVVKNYNPKKQPSEESLERLGNVLRPVYVLISCIIAYIIPFQGPFVAFVGNLCTTLLALIFPALMDLSLRYPDYYGRYRWILIKDICIIIVGLISWTIGVYLSAKLIYHRLVSLLVYESSDYF